MRWGSGRQRTLLFAGAVVAVLTVVVSGCSATGSRAPARVVVSGQARLDPQTDSAVLPLDKYAGSTNSVIDYAQLLDTKACMAGKGFDFPIPQYYPGQENTLGWRLFGLWDMSEAEQYGYSAPPNPGAAAGLKIQQSEQLTPAENAALPGCEQRSQSRFPDDANGLAHELGGEAYGQTLNDATGKKIIAQWNRCMRSQGIKLNATAAGPLVPAVTDSGSPADQILLAVKDVQCKTKYNVAQRLGDIDASYQVVLIRADQAALNQELKKNNAVYAAADKYLTAHE